MCKSTPIVMIGIGVSRSRGGPNSALTMEFGAETLRVMRVTMKRESG